MKSSDAKASKYVYTTYRFLCKYWYFWMGWGWDLAHLKWKYLMNIYYVWESITQYRYLIFDQEGF